MNSGQKKKNDLHCKLCNVQLQTYTQSKNHEYAVHVDKVKVFIGEEITEVTKINDKFNCIECSSSLSTYITFKNHLKCKHDGRCEIISNNKKKRALEDIDDDLTSIELKHWKQPNPQINLDEFDTNQPQKVLKVDKNTSIMLASNTYSGSHKEKENSIMLTKIGNIEPIILTCESGKNYHFLTSSENICEVLAEQPSGSWSLPAFFPQTRFATAQIFAGSILVNESKVLLINCTEPYGRSKVVEAHHERRVAALIHNSSFPKQSGRYGWITSVTTKEDNATKLKIGTKLSNLLVTSSARIDMHSALAVEIGPSTNNFIGSNDTRIYLNIESLRLGKILMESQSTTCIESANFFYQLGQVRSKFYCRSTYTLCRSSSTFASDVAYMPYTIWTICDYDCGNQSDTQCRMFSRFFQSIATQVIKDGTMAKIKIDLLNDLQNKLKDGDNKQSIHDFIEQNQEPESILIINNLKLNELLTDIAHSMTTTLKQANAVVAYNLSKHLFK
ncbi:MAG: hypothetical protein EXX96DRAFT_643307 [Benjaminiella poitrasii]|nr:MAG: hypothetical protein EXX96DRAFT_643307 [Benjaminiella poitrasii]